MNADQMRTDELSYYPLTDEQRAKRLLPGTLWQAKDNWNFREYKFKKDEIVMVVNSELFYILKWAEAHNRDKLKTHIKFIGNKIATMTITVQNWFLCFEEL